MISPGQGRARCFSRLTLGCSQIGSLGNPASSDDLIRLIQAAIDLGVTAFDTADIYGQGDSERIIGKALRGRRAQAMVVTKFGKGFSPVMSALRPFKPVIRPLLGGRRGQAVAARRSGHMREDFRIESLSRALEGSLRRLRVEQVDAVLLHGPPADVLVDPAIGEFLASVRASGKAARTGVSVETLADVEAALRFEAVDLLQVPYDLVDTLEAPSWTEALSARGVALMAREVIRLQPGLPAVEAVRQAASRASLATVVVGTRRLDHLRELAAVAG